MIAERRRFTMLLAGVTLLLWRKPTVLLGQSGSQRPAPPDRVLAPEGRATMSREALKAALQDNQKQIKKDIEKLYELAGELKKEVEKADASEVLSLNVVRKAEEVEKLAKHIKNLARG